MRVLESERLVEIQHTNPQRFRALSVAEATDILDSRYSDRIENLQETLQKVEPQEEVTQQAQEVWSLSEHEAIAARTHQILSEADAELIVVVGMETMLTDRLSRALETATDRGVEVLLGAVTSSVRTQLREEVPDAEVFKTKLDWLEGDDKETASIGLLVMADRNTLLVSSQTEHGRREEPTETAIFGSGFTNGLVVIARRLLSRGLLAQRGPAQ